MLRTLTILTLSISLIGCANDDVESVEHNAETDNGLSLNGLSLNGLSLNGLSLNGLSLNGLSLNGLDSPEGRNLMRYVVRCALPAGTQMTALGDDGTEYTYDGVIGLAPEWSSGALSESGQRWVSACILAHVNYYGTQVPISLRGGHPALATTPAEEAAFTYREGAFFGNIFAADGTHNACSGSADTGSADGDLRVCTDDADGEETTCGFVYHGACDDGEGMGACGSIRQDGSFADCPVEEAITVFHQ